MNQKIAGKLQECNLQVLEKFELCSVTVTKKLLLLNSRTHVQNTAHMCWFEF